ncbi:MAG: hypothetical protein QG575_930 [Euryarchaeota archaeon]|nr:hypothetical protein [Euryarchaeota archaeon]
MVYMAMGANSQVRNGGADCLHYISIRKLMPARSIDQFAIN